MSTFAQCCFCDSHVQAKTTPPPRDPGLTKAIDKIYSQRSAGFAVYSHKLVVETSKNWLQVCEDLGLGPIKLTT